MSFLKRQKLNLKILSKKAYQRENNQLNAVLYWGDPSNPEISHDIFFNTSKMNHKEVFELYSTSKNNKLHSQVALNFHGCLFFIQNLKVSHKKKPLLVYFSGIKKSAKMFLNYQIKSIARPGFKYLTPRKYLYRFKLQDAVLFDFALDQYIKEEIEPFNSQ